MKGRGGAAVSDVFRYEEVPPSHQPSGGGHEAGSPLGRRPWSARRGHGLPRASATWLAPGCRPHRGAAPQLRFVVGRYAATAARYAARRLVPRSGTTSWPRRGLGAAASRHRYGVPVQSLFMKPSSLVKSSAWQRRANSGQTGAHADRMFCREYFYAAPTGNHGTARVIAPCWPVSRSQRWLPPRARLLRPPLLRPRLLLLRLLLPARRTLC